MQPANPFMVPFDGSFVLSASAALRTPRPPASETKARLKQLRERLRERQRVFAADGRRALLIVLQGMDASGKDSAVRTVMQGVNPAGCQVWSFKVPTPEEKAHDFLWRSARRLPARGMIGIFNRSYYEDVLVARVHPELLADEWLDPPPGGDDFWQQRYASIREHEAHLARNGTIILKFWLNLSREEQRRRFLRRLNHPHKHWKFSAADVHERRHWNAYMHAYEAALNATSRPHAPWYAIPADDKHYCRAHIAEVIVTALEQMDLRYPEPSAEEAATLARTREQLEAGEEG